jgi:hypothetical protein
MHDCEEIVPANGIVDGYDKCSNSTCTFCPKKCKPPTINDHIDFLDGFKSDAGWIGFGILVGVTVVWQLYSCLIQRPKINAEYEKLMTQPHFNDTVGMANMHSPLNHTETRDTLLSGHRQNIN